MKVLIFGTGDYYRKYIKWFKKEDVIALLDNDCRKQGSLLDGFEVLSPEAGITKKYEKIFILSVHEKVMREQLLCLGVEKHAFALTGKIDAGLFQYAEILDILIKCVAAHLQCNMGKGNITGILQCLRRLL